MTSKIIQRDHEGNVYLIPQNLKDQFVELNESAINAEFLSDDWLAIPEQIKTEFGQYLVEQ